MSIKLLHLANFRSTNIGNGALIFGTERVLREDIAESISFTAEPWDDYVIENTLGPKRFDESFVDRVNDHDGLLVGGAVTFNGREHLTETGMRFNLPLPLWSHIEKPIIFYGNACRFWPSQRYHNIEQLKATIEYVTSAPNIFFGVRNDGSKALLESIADIQHEKIVTIPDPGMFVPAEVHDYPELETKKKNILISLNNEDESDRFPDPQKKLSFLEALSSTMQNIAQEWDVNFILCPHYFDDYKIMSELVDLLPSNIVHQRTISTGLLPVPQTPYFYGRYAKADLVLSMRIHSLSPAIGLSTPVIPLVSQERVAHFLEDIGLTDLGVDIFSATVEEELYKKMSYGLSHATELRKQMQAAAEKSRDRIARFNADIKQLLV